MGRLADWRLRRAEKVVVRAAAMPLYSRFGGRPFVVPTLTFRSQREDLDLPAAASENPMIYGPVYQLAMALGHLGIKVFQMKETDGRWSRDEAMGHPSYQVLRRPNPDLTRNLLISGTVQNLLYYRHAGWLKVRDGSGPPVELWPVEPWTLEAVPGERRLIDFFVVNKGQADEREVSRDDLCYFRLLPAPTAWTDGGSPMFPLAAAAGMGFSAIDSAEELFANGILERRWIHSQEEVDDDQFAKVQAQMTMARADRTAIPWLEGDVDLREMGPGPDDESMFRGIEQSRKIVYDTLGLPLDGDERRFYSQAVAPIADAIEQELERSFFSEWPEDKVFGQFAFRELLKGTPAERAQLHQTLILSGQETLDEARSDEDRGPVPGGDKVYLPLNVDAVRPDGVGDANGFPRESDSAGGLGGDEGKGVLVNTPTRMRAKFDNFGRHRDRTVDRHGEALQRKIAGLLNDEVRAILRHLGDTPGAPVRMRLTTIPSPDELDAILRKMDPALRDLIAGFLASVFRSAFDEAAALIDALAGEVSARMDAVLAERVTAVVSRFGTIRAERLAQLLADAIQEGWTDRMLYAAIRAEWKDLAAHIASGIARTEVAFAHQQGALYSWASSGVASVDFRFGGGPCTTGVCQRAAAGGPYPLGTGVGDVGYSFTGADAPPLHPNCTCYLVPHFDRATIESVPA